MPNEPTITVSNLRLTSHRCRPGGVAAWADLSITGSSGITHEWKNTRLVFEGFWPVDIPIGRYCLLVEGQHSPRTYRRGTRLIPPCWRYAARWAIYDAAVAAEEAQKKREAEEIAVGTRFAPLPLEMITPKRKEAAW